MSRTYELTEEEMVIRMMTKAYQDVKKAYRDFRMSYSPIKALNYTRDMFARLGMNSATVQEDGRPEEYWMLRYQIAQDWCDRVDAWTSPVGGVAGIYSKRASHWLIAPRTIRF